MTPFKKLAILGAGSWGLTLAWIAGLRACPIDTIVLWSRDEEKVRQLQTNRTVAFPVPVTLPPTVAITANLAEAVQDADVVLLVVTAQATRQVARQLRETGVLKSGALLVNASKGLEFATTKPMSAVIAEELPTHEQAVLSGPTLAKEILRGLPTAASIASTNRDVAEYLQNHLSCSERFRLYSNTDMVGVELGGALKNVFAIASGFMQAKAMGENARAALMTRGLAEMARFSLQLGAQAQTVYGLSGLGDLLATCNSPLSRNYQVGYRLAKGETLESILADMRVAAEGVKTAYAMGTLAERLGLDVPVVQLVINSLDGNYISDEMMIRSLMSRRLKAEHSSELSAAGLGG